MDLVEGSLLDSHGNKGKNRGERKNTNRTLMAVGFIQTSKREREWERKLAKLWGFHLTTTSVMRVAIEF